MAEPATATDTLQVPVCIAGGGPAGMMLGFLLARAGVQVVVLEKHADFLRDFRGDTVHPSTLELMYELGLLDKFLKLPHDEVRQFTAYVGKDPFTIADLTHLPTHCKYLAFMPQWEFLNFLVEEAKKYQAFRCEMQAEVQHLIIENDQVVGVRATTPSGPLEVRATLTVAADGRNSTARSESGLELIDLGAPIDVLWFRLPRQENDSEQVLGRFGTGRMVVMLNRTEYWQCAFVIRKGGYDEVRSKGLAWLQQQMVDAAPFVADRVAELDDWDKVKLLTVAVNRLRRWYRPGLLCIGDAAHAMSPVGGVGINLAVQDAVATANILVEPLLKNALTTQDLERVQRRREFPVRVIQRFQVFVHRNVLNRALSTTRQPRLPWCMKLIGKITWLRRIPAYMIGIGVRPEHIRTREAKSE